MEIQQMKFEFSTKVTLVDVVFGEKYQNRKGDFLRTVWVTVHYSDGKMTDFKTSIECGSESATHAALLAMANTFKFDVQVSEDLLYGAAT